MNDKAWNDSEERRAVKEMIEREDVEVVCGLRTQFGFKFHVKGSGSRLDDSKVVITGVETLGWILLEVSFAWYDLVWVGTSVWQQITSGLGGRGGRLGRRSRLLCLRFRE